MSEPQPSHLEVPQSPAGLTATEACIALANGQLTSEALVSSCLRRVSERDAAVEAFVCLDSAKVIADARASDAARQHGDDLGPLAGIPVAIKDIIDTADYPTENGIAIFAGRQPAADASVVSQLKAAGAIIFGKTVTTELAFFGPGKTKNPHDPSRTPGGSSSGSAAAVADFQVPLALGTQTAGSLIRPASYCGAIGFKPTFGAVSRTGVLAQSEPLDTIGGYARSVDDIALMMHAISNFDAADAEMKQGAAFPNLPLQVPSQPPRFAFVKSPAWHNADADAQRAFEAFASSFGTKAEVAETPLPPDFDGSLRLQQIVQFSDIAKNYGPIADANPDRVSGKLKEIIAEGRTFSKADYRAARADRDPLYESLQPLLAHYDAIITPAAPGVALQGLSATGSPMFNALWTYLGMPCISLPLLSIDGLPLGLQLVTARDSDRRLLEIAKWVMRAAA